jgi:hypothetical protein
MWRNSSKIRRSPVTGPYDTTNQKSLINVDPNILGKADKNWKRDHADKLFKGSFLAPTPSVWANQRFSLICQTNLSNHIRASLTKIKYDNSRSTGNTISPATSSDDDDNQADYDGWKFYDGPLDGESVLNVERYGHDTASLEIIDGSLSQTTVYAGV